MIMMIIIIIIIIIILVIVHLLSSSGCRLVSSGFQTNNMEEGEISGVL